jgi:hypothetical protein
LVGLVLGLKSSCFGSWHAAGVKLVGMVLGLSIGEMPVRVGRFLVTGVTHVSLWPLVTMGNLGASS